jgi:outer membrane protein TolC
LNEDVSIADFEIQVRNLVRDVEVAYWNLYVAYRGVSTAIIGRNSAMATARFAELQLENGAGTVTEVSQAKEQYFNFRAILESALAGSNVLGDERLGVYGTERALRELMGEAATDGRLIRPIDEPSLARMNFDWCESIAQMLYLSPELRRGRVVIKQRELEQISAKNQLLPEVNLSLLYRWVGVGDTLGPPSGSNVPFPGRGSSALDELTSGNYQEGSVRLEITPPAIGGRRERARIRGSQLRIQQSRAFLAEAERLLVSQLSDAVGKTATHYQLMQTQAQRWQAAEREVEARLAEFKGGRSPVNVVLQSQQRRASAQIDYYRALGEYNKSINYVDYLKGTMLANSNITLAEGPWNKKAYWDALERARERSAGKKGQYGVSRPSVVRRGPVCDAESAAACSVDQHGQPLSPDGIILEGPVGDTMYDSELENQPIEMDDVPLGEMGSPAEMFAPPSNMEVPATPGVIPTPLPDTIPDRPLQGAEQTSFSDPESLSDPGSFTEPANYTEPVSNETDVNISGAPAPVSRKPIPIP